MINISNFTKEHMLLVCAVDDLDAAILVVQKVIGQQDGDIGGIYWNEEKSGLWQDADKRQALINGYLQCELSYAKLDNETEIVDGQV